MSLTAGQIVSLASSIAGVPGYLSQAALFLNAILSELCEDYDLALARGLFSFTMSPTLAGAVGSQNVYASGPYALPADYLRTSGSSGSKGAQTASIWYLDGVPYPMLPGDLAEFDVLVQQAGISSYPYLWVTDMSQSPPVGYAYPPPSGAFAANIRYQRLMPDLATDPTTGQLTAAAAAAAPWFPSSSYLVEKLAGRLMQLAGDIRAPEYLGTGQQEGRADRILRDYLKLKDDDANRAKTVQLDRRRFKVNRGMGAFSSLPNTKTIGW